MSNRLPILAEEIRRAHADVQEAAKTAAEHAITAGHALIEAKELVKHGEWLQWLRDHCALAERTAQLYMKIARSGHSAEVVAALGLKGAEKALTLQYCYHRPLYDGDEHEQREWRLFALFLVRVCGRHPHGVGDHIDWIGRHNFKTVEEWLTEGLRWSRAWQTLSDKQKRACERQDAHLLAVWRKFEGEHAALTIEQVDAEFWAEAENAPDLPPLGKVRRKLKSATVADLGGAP